MPDRWAVAMAVAAALGALQASNAPVAAGVAIVVGALAWRSPVLVCVGVALSASALADAALDGLRGVQAGDVAATVTLVSDPAPAFGGVRADARLGDRRVELRASGSSADALAPLLAGEVVRVRGTLAPAPADAPWLRARHVAGRLTVLKVEGSARGAAIPGLANDLRRVLVDGARPLGAVHRSLFTGLVIGDDRAQPPALADDFLGAGMTHLLAVSGQNVAFVLALAGALLRRLRLWPRLVVTIAVIGFFAVMTRFEPSVVRASAMAAVAATVVTIGRPVSRLRIIAIAVTALLLVDPLLVHAVGFRLSLAAATAIVVLAPPISEVLPGPPALRDAVGVTLAAQLGVAPVLLATFGPIPVASIPANLLAVPVAGLVMVWGLTAGLLAGVLGEPAATVLHLPTRLALDWLELVAARAAAAPLGDLGAVHVAVVAVALLAAAAAQRATPTASVRREPRHPWNPAQRTRGLGLVAIAVAVLAAVLTAHAPAPLRSNPMVGLVRWHAAGTDVVVLGGVGGRASLGPRPVLEALRRAGVGAIDLLVVADGGVDDRTLAAVTDAHPTGETVVHVGVAAGLPVTRAPAVDTIVTVGALAVRLVPLPDRLVVDARPAG